MVMIMEATIAIVVWAVVITEEAEIATTITAIVDEITMVIIVAVIAIVTDVIVEGSKIFYYKKRILQNCYSNLKLKLQYAKFIVFR